MPVGNTARNLDQNGFSPPYVKDPGPGAGEGVSAVDDVSVLGEAGEHVAHALLQGVQLRVHQHLDHQVLGSKLDQALSCVGNLDVVLTTWVVVFYPILTSTCSTVKLT